MNIEDKWLVWRFNRGDDEAVRLLYEKHKQKLLALAASLVREPAAAEDIVHDVFIAFLRRQHFELTGSLQSYLATCVANAARNALRAQSRHEPVPLPEDPPEVRLDAQPDGKAMFSEESQLLACALGELPYEQREVVMLHIHSGLRFSEIAALQSVSINTVQGRYRYGLEKLRSKLNSEVSRCNPSFLSKSVSPS